MATKPDFSPMEWNTLRDTPYLVGFAMLLAGASGLGTIRELIALSQGVIENQSSGSALVRELTAKDEMSAAQASVRQSFRVAQGTPSSDSVRRRALEQARSSIAILTAKGTKDEAEAYRRMLYGIAEKVANAAREGGFLGFGGTQVSEGERLFLDELGITLQLEQVKNA